MAQSAGTPTAVSNTATGLGDIIVTARRREESLQSVPIAVTALNTEALRSRNITTAADLQNFTPSLSVQSNALVSRESSVFSIRGQGSSFGGLLPGVVVYFADVPLDPAGGAQIGLFDLNSVQVLRGPQGTLFGKNTNGGAVLLTPTAPGDTSAAFVDMSVGNLAAVDVKAGVTIPIAEGLSVRASGNIVRRDGFTKNLRTGKDLDNRDSKMWRVFLRWDPSDTFRNDLIYSGLDSQTNGTGFILRRLSGTPLSAFLRAELAPALARGKRAVDYDDGGLVGFDASTQAVFNTTTLDLDAIKLKNVVSYQRVKVCSGTDNDGTATVFNYTTCFPNALTQGLPTRPDTDLKIFTEEFQVSGSAFDDRFDWVAGGFYSSTKTPGSLSEPSIYRTSRTGPSANVSALSMEDTSKAAYAQGTIKFTDALRLTGGIRKTWDNRKMAFGTRTTANNGATYTCRNNIYGVPANASFRECYTAFEGDFSGITYNVSLDYQVSKRTLFYAATKRGYKSGGFNNATVAPNARYKPETVTEYEAGVKTDFDLGGVNGRFNLAVFHDEFRDIQRVTTGQVGGVVYANVVNVEKASLTGVEVEGTLALTPEFSISGNYSFLDSGKYKGFTDGVPPVDVSGSQYIGLSKHSGSATAEYKLPVGPSSQLVASGTYSYRSSNPFLPNTVTNLAAVAPAFDVVNARLEWRGVMEGLDLAIWGRNITNNTYVVGGSAADSLGFTSYIYGEPRTYGAQLVYRFGQ